MANTDVRFIVALYNRRLSSRQIAEEYGYSTSTVRYHRIKRNIKSEHWDYGYLQRSMKRKENKELLKSMRIKDAAKHFGVTNTTIKNIRKKLGITSHRNLHLNKDFLNDAQTMAVKDVMDKWNVSESRVYQIRKLLKEQTNHDN